MGGVDPAPGILRYRREYTQGVQLLGKLIPMSRTDCLVTGGGTATLTAVVVESNVSEPGQRFGLSIQRGRGGEPDRLGFGWDIVNFEPRATDDQDVELPTGTCMAPAPFAPVVKGGFTVKHADLPPLPATPKAAGKSDNVQ
jgi:hypothetical protein